MSELSWEATKRLVFQRARGCCEYCQSCEDNTGQAMHIEHIIPSGGNNPENLCLSCGNCNLSKAEATSAVDPESGEIAPLFNPRTDIWVEHLMWIESGSKVLGLTPTGRATIQRLKINRSRIVKARLRWIK